MQFDLTNLTAGEVAALTAIATLTAAAIGGVVALTVAFVNTRTVRNVARFNARSAYLQTICKPLLEKLDEEVLLSSQLVERINAYAPETSRDQWFHDVYALLDPHTKRTLLDTTPLGIRAMLKRDEKLFQAFQALSLKRASFLNKVMDAIEERVDHPGTNASRRELVNEGHRLIDQTVAMRMEIERHMFD